jgi:hypothetical protein
MTADELQFPEYLGGTGGSDLFHDSVVFDNSWFRAISREDDYQQHAGRNSDRCWNFLDLHGLTNPIRKAVQFYTSSLKEKCTPRVAYVCVA